ncbi:hypothetical protein Nepgr_024165 [Nepenthes gracilis]|uniref:Protein disulfide-isomerase n=1 Tax=Nepenthes gracilis TaxID=150966 RepID=A0AAD3T5E5_NEPGR|nr:hypothetical protein Nepgr_024165 [Nepenthes gracilis]
MRCGSGRLNDIEVLNSPFEEGEWIIRRIDSLTWGHALGLNAMGSSVDTARSLLQSHGTAIALAKVDSDDELNKDLVSDYGVTGFPTLKILRNGGKIIQDYNGPRDADYLKKRSGPASAEIKSAKDATSIIGNDKVIVVGIFREFAGEEFANFTAMAEKLRSDYEFGHTLDAKLLPLGESSVKKPTVRLIKPFDELFVDFQDFHVEALEKFVEEASTPTVTLFNKDPSNHPYVLKFFDSPNTKVMLYQEVAKEYKGKGVRFLLADVDAAQGAFQFFGLEEDQVPLIIIQTNDGQKYLKQNLKPDDISSWFKEFKDGKVLPYKKCEPIPEPNDEPVKVVVADTLEDMVLNSDKNVLLEFYAPWCGQCKKLAPILDEVAVHFEDDPDVIIAMLDAAANDIPLDTFEVKGFPTLYFISSGGNIVQYDGDRSKEDIIDFVENNRDQVTQDSIGYVAS